ncbi:transcriptional repressor TraM, partial [Acinetobacter baumannii]
ATVLIRPIVRLTKDLPKSVLEPIVAEALQRYRLLRDVAERKFPECGDEVPNNVILSEARRAYIRAMIDCHAQQDSLSTLLEVLG